MELTPGAVTHVAVGFDENADEVALRLGAELGVETIIGADAFAHVSLLRDTVREELALALEHRGVAPAEMATRVAVMLRAVGLEQLAERNPSRLSGGQTRRLVCAAVAIARPPVLIVVEPYVGLDPTSRAQVSSVLHSLPETAVVTVGQAPLDDAAPVSPLPALPALGETHILGPITATRSAGRRRWWHLKPPTGTDFAVGPVEIPVRLGGITWLRGDNGSGKTTLLRAAAGLDGNDAVAEGLFMALQSPMDQAVATTLVDMVGDADLCAELGLPADEHPLDASASQLRVAQVAMTIRRAVACGADVPIIILDEPDTLLDGHGRALVNELIRDATDRGIGVVLTCHDPGFVGNLAADVPVETVSISTPTG
ncbi:ATP-binding cassette domain-containing protein [uncultured Corynebacterium sp.]|uniref:ATP-binding cassette domain-containing protein n=1 Tax=uncultured Corynebacterium sp. TaxID=159447 RepID=UPI0025E0F88A|nr:ATP-binding cassette domain-containing protein [uncultured Corynebacterium sp.]